MIIRLSDWYKFFKKKIKALKALRIYLISQKWLEKVLQKKLQKSSQKK
jgi:hypothetical protein